MGTLPAARRTVTEQHQCGVVAIAADVACEGRVVHILIIAGVIRDAQLVAQCCVLLLQQLGTQIILGALSSRWVTS